LLRAKRALARTNLHRILEIQYKSAVVSGAPHSRSDAGRKLRLWRQCKTVEMDETTSVGWRPACKEGSSDQDIVLTLSSVAYARSFHVDSTSIADIIPIVSHQRSRESVIMTDEARHYQALGKEYLSHDAVNHAAKDMCVTAPMT